MFFSAIIGLTFPYMLQAIKISASFYIYASLNAAAFAFCWLFVVETKGKSRDELFAQLTKKGWRR